MSAHATQPPHVSLIKTEIRDVATAKAPQPSHTAKELVSIVPRAHGISRVTWRTLIPLKPKKSGIFSYDQALGEDILSVQLSGIKPGSVAHQFTMQEAIGAEGPWFDLPGVKKNSAWQPIELGDDNIVALISQEEWRPLLGKDDDVVITVTPEIAAKAVRESEHDAESMKWWLEQAKQCKGSDTGPCYSYRSHNRLRFTGEDGKQYQLVISYQGGC